MEVSSVAQTVRRCSWRSSSPMQFFRARDLLADEVRMLCTPKWMRVIYPGVDCARFAPDGARERMVVTVGTASEATWRLKGLDVFALLSTGPGCTLCDRGPVPRFGNWPASSRARRYQSRADRAPPVGGRGRCVFQRARVAVQLRPAKALGWRSRRRWRPVHSGRDADRLPARRRGGHGISRRYR